VSERHTAHTRREIERERGRVARETVGRDARTYDGSGASAGSGKVSVVTSTYENTTWSSTHGTQHTTHDTHRTRRHTTHHHDPGIRDGKGVGAMTHKKKERLGGSTAVEFDVGLDPAHGFAHLVQGQTRGEKGGLLRIFVRRLHPSFLFR
jgi:hypothetical protein